MNPWVVGKIKNYAVKAEVILKLIPHIQKFNLMQNLILMLFAFAIFTGAEELKAESYKKRLVLAAEAYGKNIIAIRNESGEVLWQHKVKGGQHDIHMLENGNILFQDGWTKIVEMTLDKKVVWSYDSATMNGNQGKRVEVHAFQRVGNGLTMIVESGPGRIIEVDKDGKIHHQFKLKLDKPNFHRDTRLAVKLRNGHYLVCHEGDKKVREYNYSGKPVWEYNVGHPVYGAIRLKNGNTLIASGGGSSYIEVNPSKEVVWKIEKQIPNSKIALKWTTSLEQRENGNLILGNCHAGKNNPQMIELSPDKKVLWKFHDFKTFGNGLAISRVLTNEQAVIVRNKLGISFENGDNKIEGKTAFYREKVHPILTKHCYKCHGTDKHKDPRGGVRLTSYKNLLKGSEIGPIIDKDNLADSLILKMISYADEDHQMPPKGKLSQINRDILKQWVTSGAEFDPELETYIHDEVKDAPHIVNDKSKNLWAFRPLHQVRLPKTKDKDWAKNEIDQFVLAKLEENELKPNPKADKATLLRRASYDLTGLPPSSKDYENFLKDTSANAFEKVIDRLLASPQYGEKWGRHWLDLVRYAETNGYERDDPKGHTWRYRDYVVNSFNKDKSYKDFIIEQLAGDELKNRNHETMIATGYYRLGIWDDEPSDKIQHHYDYLDDIVRTTSEVMLGMTIGCSRCHNHKIDPIPMDDYYKFLSFFKNIKTNRYAKGDGYHMDVSTAEQLKTRKLLQDKNNKLAEEINKKLILIREEFKSKLEENKKVKVSGKSHIEGLGYEYYRNTWQKLPNFADYKYEDSGDIKSNLFDISPATRNDSFGFVFKGSIRVPKDGEYTFYLDSDDGSKLILNSKTLITYDGVHGLGRERKGKVSLKKGLVPIRLEYFQGHGGKGLSVAWSGPGMTRNSLSASHNSSKSNSFAHQFRRQGLNILGKAKYDEYRKLEGKYNALRKPVASKTLALIVSEKGKKVEDTHVLIRGSHKAKGKKVEPAFPAVLTSLKPNIQNVTINSSGRRLTLAKWIVSDKNPVARRVIVNRIWQYHFGRGLSKTSSDFGRIGMEPTHPDLLEYLSHDFVANGWSFKKMHKKVMLSNTYQMSSKSNVDGLEKDVMNDYFWRFNMRRLSAEEMRDSVLNIAGKLDLKMGGPSVYPTIQREVLMGQSKPGYGWHQNNSDANNARRTIYTHVKRSLNLPFVEAHDMAPTDTSCAERFTTTVPTQSLTMLNGPFVNKHAELMSQNIISSIGVDAEPFVKEAMKRAYARKIKETEVKQAVSFIEEIEKKFNLKREEALKQFCLLVLNTNEFIYLD